MKRTVLYTFVIILFFTLVMVVRYGNSTHRMLPGGYVVETHRDAFCLFGTPGGGSDVHGYCKVFSKDKNIKSTYYYLEMIWFESEINKDTIKINNGKITVESTMLKPIKENLWRLFWF